MFPSWWRNLLKWAGAEGKPGRHRPCIRPRSRPSNRPAIEQLEDRIVPTTPSVMSINRSVPLGPETNATSVSYAVTFNESVTGVAAHDFKVVTDGSAKAAAPVAVSGTGSEKEKGTQLVLDD